MPSRVRSIFQRTPTPVPPPVVCRVEPEPRVHEGTNVEIKLIDSIPRRGLTASLLVTLAVKPISFKSPITGVFQVGGTFWTPEQIPPITYYPDTDEEVPIPSPEYQTIDFVFEQTRHVTYFVARYDLVIFFRWMQNATVYGITYVDLGRLARNEEHGIG